MYGLLFSVYFLATLIECASPMKPKTYMDIPTGHCDPICSCRMGSLYYSEGEQWTFQDDPCTVYKCSSNGLVETIQTGCLYKGTCHPVASTWSEGCNSFTCTANTNSTYYTLTEAGCRAPDGGCIKLGEKKTLGCEVIECQIQGDYLVSHTISLGCSVNGTCKRTDSYWHDGCTIFTCTKENGTTVERALSNEVMKWPEGNYALLKPKSGCPNDNPSVWSEGSRKHYGAGRNTFSPILSLAGNYAEKFISHDFCIHGTGGLNVPGTWSSELKGYRTYWEPGKYCILRKNGHCPRGFTNGYIAFGDVAAKSVSSGTLPDGNFTIATGFNFCCRKDGPLQTEITLPKDNSFVLFMEGGETECQNVKGMSSSMEYFTFDGKASAKHEKTGHIPYAKISKGDLTMKYCVYTPSNCGCLDDSGQSIDVNTEKEIDCVLKRCVSENGKNVLKIVSGGCSVNGACQPEGYKWSVNEGDTCRISTCEKVYVGSFSGPRISHRISTGFPGCRDGTECINVGEEIRRDCYTRRCTKDPAAQTAAMQVIKADCPWLDTCKAPNSTWNYNCMTYRCDMNMESGQYLWNVQPVGYGCADDKGNCYEVGQNVSGQCFDAVCQLNENKTVVYLDVKKRGCVWKDGCRDVNDTWDDGCHSFKCEWRETQSGFIAVVNATRVSCEWNGTCYNEGDIWFDGCIEYKCMVSRAGGTVNWSVKTVSLACKGLGDKCVAVGEQTVENCVTYKCMQRGDQIGLHPTSVGCKWNETCYNEDETWSDTVKCVDYQCLKQILPVGPVMQVSASYGCAFNKTCKAVNTTWSDGCKTRKCEVLQQGNMIQRSISAISAGCDDEGICRNVGYMKVTNTCMEYECIFNDTYKDSFFSLTGGACRSDDGVCHDVGVKWTEKRTNTCLDFECQKEVIGYLSKMLEQKCLDASGICQPVGASGFRAMVKGKLGTDCRCVTSNEPGAGIAIRCKG